MNLKTLAAALLVGVSSTAALAADLPSRNRAPAPIIAQAPIFTWTGLYAGLQAGYAWDNVSVDNAFAAVPVNVSRKGFVGGGHIGYLYQTGPAVFGLEGDIEGTTIKGSGLRASLRGRLGLAADRALFYVTGGGALANQNYALWSPFAPAFTNSASATKLGWTAGAGVEYAFAPNWSARVEYRYSDFGKLNVANFVTPANVSRRENAVRLGVSYHFGGYGAPVVAKY
ncbi:MAG: outer membrane protein [Rhodoblastus sp.]|jgi:outer membrane immunogenic protein